MRIARLPSFPLRPPRQPSTLISLNPRSSAPDQSAPQAIATPGKSPQSLRLWKRPWDGADRRRGPLARPTWQPAAHKLVARDRARPPGAGPVVKKDHPIREKKRRDPIRQIWQAAHIRDPYVGGRGSRAAGRPPGPIESAQGVSRTPLAPAHRPPSTRRTDRLPRCANGRAPLLPSVFYESAAEVQSSNGPRSPIRGMRWHRHGCDGNGCWRFSYDSMPTRNHCGDRVASPGSRQY